MAETKDKLITAESLKYVHDSLSNKIVEIQLAASNEFNLTNRVLTSENVLSLKCDVMGQTVEIPVNVSTYNDVYVYIQGSAALISGTTMNITPIWSSGETTIENCAFDVWYKLANTVSSDSSLLSSVKLTFSPEYIGALTVYIRYTPAHKNNVDVKTTEAEEEAEYSEPLTLTVTVSTGWTGDLTNGFTHTSGNTNPLTISLGEDTGTNIYQVIFSSSVDATGDNIFVTIGGSETFPLYGMPQPYSVGVKSVENGSLAFTPKSDYTGTITGITVKRVTAPSEVNPRLTVIDSDKNTSLEVRTSSAFQEDGVTPKANLFIGKGSGAFNTSGFGNVGFGTEVLNGNTSGFWNVGIGYNTMKANTVGSRNVAIGYIALSKNTTGHRNVAIGTFALNNNTTGYQNIAIGADNMNNNTEGFSNVSIGFQSLYKNTSGSRNVAIGQGAGQNNTTGERNTFVGTIAAPSNTTASYNTAVGHNTLVNNATGANNVAIGYNAIYKGTATKENVAVGVSALAGNSSAASGGYRNVAIGYQAFKECLNASYNIAIGHNSAATLKSGTYNIVIGAGCEVTNGKNYQVNIGNLIKGSTATGEQYFEIDYSALPTSDPNVAGRLWNDNGTVKISAGA